MDAACFLPPKCWTDMNKRPEMLVQACRRDIVDLMPREQRILTELAWQAVSQAWHDSHRTPVFYNYALGKAGFP